RQKARSDILSKLANTARRTICPATRSTGGGGSKKRSSGQSRYAAGEFAGCLATARRGSHKTSRLRRATRFAGRGGNLATFNLPKSRPNHFGPSNRNARPEPSFLRKRKWANPVSERVGLARVLLCDFVSLSAR